MFSSYYLIRVSHFELLQSLKLHFKVDAISDLQFQIVIASIHYDQVVDSL